MTRIWGYGPGWLSSLGVCVYGGGAAPTSCSLERFLVLPLQVRKCHLCRFGLPSPFWKTPRSPFHSVLNSRFLQFREVNLQVDRVEVRIPCGAGSAWLLGSLVAPLEGP